MPMRSSPPRAMSGIRNGTCSCACAARARHCCCGRACTIGNWGSRRAGKKTATSRWPFHWSWSAGSEAVFERDRQRLCGDRNAVAAALEVIPVQAHAEVPVEVVAGADAEVRLGRSSAVAAEAGGRNLDLAARNTGAAVDEESGVVRAEVLLADQADADRAQLARYAILRLVLQVAVEAFDGEVVVEVVATTDRVGGIVVAVTTNAIEIGGDVAAAEFATDETAGGHGRGGQACQGDRGGQYKNLLHESPIECVMPVLGGA